MSIPRYRIRFALPGPVADWGAVRGMHISTQDKHDVLIPKDIGHDSCGNFDVCFCEAMNAFEEGDITHLVYLNADVHPLDLGWLDTMVEVAERRQVSLVSAPVAIKDNRAVVSCGASDDPDGETWLAHLVKIDQLCALPFDFDAKDMGHPGKALLHNHGCMLMDLRDPKWHTTDANGDLVICFNFPRRNRRDEDGRWRAEGNSEDFYFSRMAHKLGIRSVVTRRLKIFHAGRMLFPNWDRRPELKNAEHMARLLDEVVKPKREAMEAVA